MTCDICGRQVQDKREHRHTAARPELRAAENYGRFKAQQERDLIRDLVRRTHADLDREIATENRAVRRIEDR